MERASRLDRSIWQVLAGGSVLVLSEIMMLNRVEPFSSWFYSFAWWSYILMVDGVVFGLKGTSLIRCRFSEFLRLSGWSLFVWLFFELINLFMKNWYYVNVEPRLGLRWFGYAISYATVLPALFETRELIDSLGIFRTVKVPSVKVSQKMLSLLTAIGIAFFLAPVIIPRYGFPLVWGSLIFLLEPINYRKGFGSLLKELEKGSLGLFVQLLLAGLVCGLLWEFWNYWAKTKWIYTVPFFDELKLFEMPVLGFFGFPPFAVECYVICQFMEGLRQRRCLGSGSHMLSGERPFCLAAGTFMVLFSLFMFRMLDIYTVGSYQVKISDLLSDDPIEAKRLIEAGIEDPEQLLALDRGQGSMKDVARRTGLSIKRLQHWIQKAKLVELKGMGLKNYRLLAASGISTIEELAKQRPNDLYIRLKRMGQINHEALKTPRRAMVKIWIVAARKAISG